MRFPTAPARSPVVSPGSWTLTPDWARWLSLDQYDAVVAAPRILGAARKDTQSVALVAADIPTPTLTAGLYRVSVYLQLTRAATTSSSLSATIRWTYNGVAQELSTDIMVGNTTDSFAALCFPIRVDNGTRVTYETGYTSVGVTAMRYSVDATLEALAV